MRTSFLDPTTSRARLTLVDEIWGCILFVAMFFPTPACAEEPTTQQAKLRGTADAWAVFESSCIDCHGEEDPEAQLHLSRELLSSDTWASGEALARVERVLLDGSMPPSDAEDLDSQTRDRLVSWLKQRLSEMGDQMDASAAPPVHRRLNNAEYNYSMQDLFGVDSRFDDILPPDPISTHGYRNAIDRLGMSAVQVESYLDAARRAVERYVQFGPLPTQRLYYMIEFEDLYYSTAKRYVTRERAPLPIDMSTFTELQYQARSTPPRFVDPLSPRPIGGFSELEEYRAAIPKLHQQYLALPKRLQQGELTVRVVAAGTEDRNGRQPRLRVEAGITLGDGCSIDKRLLGEVDVAAKQGEPGVFEFRARLEDIPTKGELKQETSFDQLSVFDLDQLFLSNASDDRLARFELGRGAYKDPSTGSEKISTDLAEMRDAGLCFLHLDRIEIAMVPGRGQSNSDYRWHIEVGDSLTDQGEEAVVGDVLREFMRQAWRRPVTEGEIGNKLALWRSLRNSGNSFVESTRSVLVAILVSPNFLFREYSATESTSRSKPQNAKVAQLYDAANRLSYLLWATSPDEQLLARAEDGTLGRKEVLLTQAKRLMDDGRVDRSLDMFCEQWLRLDKHRLIPVDRKAFPDFDEAIAADAREETRHFFRHIFHQDHSILDLLDSDYALLNDRMARHYGIAGIQHGDFRLHRLEQNTNRGGLLAQSSLLTIGSDGRESHPIRRGVWILDRLLGDPPPPPPPNVPTIEEQAPEILELSLLEQIEHHRSADACRGCHERIDPWGLVLEEYDALGRWRAGDLPTSPRIELPDGAKLSDAASLRSHLRNRHADKFANAFVHHYLTYAMGRSPNFTERAMVSDIVDEFVASKHRMRALVLAYIVSPLFEMQDGSK